MVCCNLKHHEHAIGTPVTDAEITGSKCETVGLDGKWAMVAIKEEGKCIPPPPGETVIFNDCSKALYFTNDKLTHTDLFILYKVIQYCADYQLQYDHDSISCINFKKDSLIIGTCNDFETTKYIYKRMQ